MNRTDETFPPCPACGATDVVPIVYGYPSPELTAESLRGEVVLGGCLVGEESPEYECRACGRPLPWSRPRAEVGA
jgi:hypothetical protein